MNAEHNHNIISILHVIVVNIFTQYMVMISVFIKLFTSLCHAESGGRTSRDFFETSWCS